MLLVPFLRANLCLPNPQSNVCMPSSMARICSTPPKMHSDTLGPTTIHFYFQDQFAKRWLGNLIKPGFTREFQVHKMIRRRIIFGQPSSLIWGESECRLFPVTSSTATKRCCYPEAEQQRCWSEMRRVDVRLALDVVAAVRDNLCTANHSSLRVVREFLPAALCLGGLDPLYPAGVVHHSPGSRRRSAP